MNKARYVEERCNARGRRALYLIEKLNSFLSTADGHLIGNPGTFGVSADTITPT
jgi:hypothetical protein